MNTLDFSGKRIGVLGAGASGRAAALLAAKLGATVVLMDKNPSSVDAEFTDTAKAAEIKLLLGAHEPEHFAGLDLLIPSPGAAVAQLKPLLPAVNPPEIMAEMEFAFRQVKKPVLAVTGTSGKTTTTLLAAAMLEAAGKRVFTGGNIGTPLSTYVLSGESAQVLVLEVSSFQLQTCSTFRPEAGILLNFSANHLDYHADMEEYLAAKLALFSRQESTDWAILPEALKPELDVRPEIKGKKIWFAPKGRFQQGLLVGEHNQANMEAAYTAVRKFGVSEEQAQKAILDFVPPPHRQTLIGEKHGVTFVDDSKATTVEALAAALKSLPGPIRLLAGGIFKGGDLASLRPLLTERVAEIGLFGASKEIFQAAWTGAAPMHWSPTLEAAMRKLHAQSRPGDCILLSPATSSFDLYTDYKARGRDFQRVFEAL